MKIADKAARSFVVSLAAIVLVLSSMSVIAPRAYAANNPVPYISGTTPVSTAPGGAQFTLTVNGANFVSGSTVNWGSTALTTTYVSSTQLTATVPASLIAGGGTGWITVLSAGSPKSNTIYFPVGSPISNLTTTTTLTATVGSNPWNIAEGDFNGDGILDLAVSNFGGGTVSVLLGNGDGTFQPQVTYSVSEPFGIAVGDVNGDGFLDLVVGSLASASPNLLIGNGDGTFHAGSSLSGGSADSLNPALADVNGDGFLDIIVPAPDGTSLYLYLGNGDGTFQSPLNVASGLSQLTSVAVGDFNGDGNLDLAVTQFTSSNVYVFLGNGNGTFQSPVTYTGVSSGWSIASDDFNEDGKLDLVVFGRGGGIGFLAGKGDGTFQTVQSITTGSYFGATVGDLNADGNLDLVAVDSTGQVLAWTGNGNGTFQSSQTIGTVTSAEYSVVLGNFATTGGLTVATMNNSQGNATLFIQAISITPSAYNFGSVNVGVASPSQAFTLKDDTPSALTISGISFAGGNPGDFSEMDTCSSPVAAGGTCTINVTFTPGGSGSRTATLLVADNGPGSPHSATLSGTGVQVPTALAYSQAPPSSIPSGSSIGTISVGVYDTRSVLVSGSGASIQVTITGPNSFSNSQTQSAVSGVATFNFSGVPLNNPGAYTVTATSSGLTSAAGNTTVTPVPSSVAAVAGSGQSAAVGTPFATSLSARVTDSFGNTVSGATVVFTAPGSGASGTFSGGSNAASAQTNTSGIATAPAFTANSTAGQYTVLAAVQGVQSTASFTLTNTAAPDYTIAANPTALTIVQGQSGTATLTVTPQGGYSGTVQFGCTGLPAGANCVFSPAQAVLNGGTAVTSQLTFNTTGTNGVLSQVSPAAPPGMPPVLKLSLAVVSGSLLALMLLGKIETRRRYGLALLVLLIASAAAIGVAGCGSTSPVPQLATPVGEYSVNVTASVNSGTSHAAVLMVTVSQ